MNAKSLARVLPLAALAAAVIASGAIGASPKHEPACKPSWFLPSLTYTVHARSIEINGYYVYVSRVGTMCHISTSAGQGFFVELLVQSGGGGDLVPPSTSSFAGDVVAGGGGGGTSVTVPLRTWCRRQPVKITLLGAAPDFPPTGHTLVIRGINIHC